MTRARGWSNTVGSADTALEAVLRGAARAGGGDALRSGVRFHAGLTLLDGRMRIRRRIGEGGMGVVYEAEDEQRGGESVALKTLSRLDPTEVYRLKNEFRSLADVSHPGVCRLHELFCDGEQWFFTMELVRGVPFDRWVRPRGALHEARARSAFARLCEAIAVIHAAGKLHRDLKPSNVLVTESGRVVVLDFGLVINPDPGGAGHTLAEPEISGTPAYMAPEQAAGAPSSAASDLYAVGVMLFEALTGKRPFDGRTGELLAAKQRDAARCVHALSPAAPADLAELCDALLAREPVQRPDLSVVEKVLAKREVHADVSVAHPRSPVEREPLLGREAERCLLRDAYRESLRGRPVVFCISGESGIGKSALAADFLDELRADEHAVVLRGRCYEQESVPFKAFDALVDELTRFLRKLSREAAGDLMPREVFALARLFPVLKRVSAVTDAPVREIADAQELQQRAFAAFGELLGRIRDRRPLVLYIDDLQWTCRDSTACMSALLAQEEPAPLLLIVSHRSERADENLLLQRNLAAARENARIEARELALSRLPLEASKELARRMLRPDVDAARIEAIANEAEGSPFFVGELARESRHALSYAGLSLREALVHHVSALGDDSRLLLELLAVAGRPLPVQLAHAAAESGYEAQDLLLSERLLRVTGAGRERTLECYHDKIRESLVSALAPPSRRHHHRSLAKTLAASGQADPEELAVHFHGAGELAQAAMFYLEAGDASGRALAFEAAASHYEQALVLGSFAGEQKRALSLKRATALAAAGRSRDAATMYRSAAVDAAPEQALDHKRSAAHLLMTSGYVDEGRTLLGEVLASIGLALPGSRRTAIASALWSRLRLSLRGFALREGAHAGPSDELRLGALWTVVQGSVGNDPFLMVEMSARYTALALDRGARAHAARALGMEAYLSSFDGQETFVRCEKLLSEAAELAERAGDPAVIGWVKEMHACAFIHQGRFAMGRAQNNDALSWLAQRCTAVPFELAGARVYAQNAGMHLGEFAEISTSVAGLVEDALRRGDMYQATLMATGFSIPAVLAHRGLADGKAQLEQARRRSQPQSSFQWSDYMVLMAELSLSLYEGDPQRALALVDQQWQALERSLLLRMHIARALTLYLCGGASLAHARRPGGGDLAEQKRVRSYIRTLRSTRVPYARGFAAVLTAGSCLGSGQAERAADALREAITLLDRSDMRMHAASARLRLGQLLGGDQGYALINLAERAMGVECILDPDIAAEMLTPGCRA